MNAESVLASFEVAETAARFGEKWEQPNAAKSSAYGQRPCTGLVVCVSVFLQKVSYGEMNARSVLDTFEVAETAARFGEKWEQPDAAKSPAHGSCPCAGFLYAWQYFVDLEGIPYGEMDAESVFEAFDVVEAAAGCGVGGMQPDAAVKSQNEKIEVVAYA